MTTTYELGDLVAERELESVAEDGTRATVVIRVGTPRPDPLSANGDWCCPHQISGLGGGSVEASFGVDSLQALLLSLFSLRIKLAERAQEASLSLNWLGTADLGLEIAPKLDQLVDPAESGRADSDPFPT